MRTLVLTLTLTALAAGPALAEPVRFRIAGEYTPTSGPSFVADAVQLTLPESEQSFDPTGPGYRDPLRVAFFAINPPSLPSDPPGGTGVTSIYYRDGYGRVTVTVTDTASGESGSVEYGVRVHAEWRYAGDDRWDGSGWAWVDWHQQSLDLGGQHYVLLPDYPALDFGPYDLNVWVGTGAPEVVPEPATRALAAVGLLPALWLRRRRAA